MKKTIESVLGAEDTHRKKIHMHWHTGTLLEEDKLGKTHTNIANENKYTSEGILTDMHQHDNKKYLKMIRRFWVGFGGIAESLEARPMP